MNLKPEFIKHQDQSNLNTKNNIPLVSLKVARISALVYFALGILIGMFIQSLKVIS